MGLSNLSNVILMVDIFIQNLKGAMSLYMNCISYALVIKKKQQLL